LKDLYAGRYLDGLATRTKTNFEVGTMEEFIRNSNVSKMGAGLFDYSKAKWIDLRSILGGIGVYVT
jgi:hypothetical protein